MEYPAINPIINPLIIPLKNHFPYYYFKFLFINDFFEEIKNGFVIFIYFYKLLYYHIPNIEILSPS